MATHQHREIALARNGVASPLYFDRQVVRAEDLTLDRTSHDAEMARMRRYLHGWGVVAGLVPAVGAEGDDGPVLAVTAGYGVTPSGEEVFLPDPVVVEDDLAALVRACCGPGEPGCELAETPDSGAEEDAAAEEEGTVTAWLVARPVQSLGDLRAGVPAGCEHPATVLLASRSCDGVSLQLLCSLPDLHLPSEPDCATVDRLLSGARRQPPDPVVLPPAVDPEHDFLVLARVVAGPEGARVELGARRRLLPTWVLQQWITCWTAYWAEHGPQPDEESEDVVSPPRPAWAELTERLRESGFTDPGDRLSGRPRLPRVLLDAEFLRSVEEVGVIGPREFLETEVDAIAEVTGMEPARVLRVKAQLAGLEPFFGSGTF